MDEFTPMDAAQYRALSRDEFINRRNQVIDLLNAESLPEGVDLDNLLAEADIIEAEVETRNRKEAAKQKLGAELSPAVVAKRNSAAAAVLNGEGEKIAGTGEVKERGFKAVSEEPFSNSIEYRRALAQHIMRQKRMPAEMIARVYQERAAGDPVAVSFPDGYTNVTDPTFPIFDGTGADALVPIPVAVSDEIVRVRKEYGILHPKVNETHFPGGVVIPISDLTVDYHWINDKQVSPYQYDDAPEAVSFTWKELEARFARTFLAEALMRDSFKSQLGEAFAEGYGRAMDAAILNGNGTTQPLGLLKDPRFIDQTSGANTGKALVVEATADDMADWTWWTKLLFKPEFNRLYRADGEWIIGDSTFGTYIQTLRDANKRPVIQWDIASADAPAKLRGNVVNTMPVSLLPDFDQASVGAVVAIFGNLKNYTLNFQPGMPLSTVSWDDHETNTHKTKVLTAVDGKMVDPNGWVVIKKKAGA